MKTHCYLLHWLSSLCIWLFTLWHSTDLYVPADICRFKAGPERRPGRAGPHSQPRDWLWLVQCQRDPCHRWAGHMKTSTLLSFPPSPAPHSPSASLLPSTLTLHLVIKMQGKGNRWTYQFSPLPFLLHFLLKETNSPFTHTSFPLTPCFLPSCYTKDKYLSLLNTRRSVTWKYMVSGRGAMGVWRLGWEVGWIARTTAMVFYPSIDCDGTGGVFTVGNAEGAWWWNCT